MQKAGHDARQQELLRAIPKVDEFLAWVAGETEAPLVMVKNTVRAILADLRARILAGAVVVGKELDRESLGLLFQQRIADRLAPNLKTLINATGVVIHTNLGRSILPAEAIDSLGRAATRYSNLEFDLATGRRGSRYSLVEDLLCELTGAEAALVVNNNAAAVLLALDTLAKGREVVVSRGQLVEIGGSFRIPDVMAKSGALLKEVGATNRTHLRDYENAISRETALLLKVHTSNFRILGFTAEVSLEEMVALGREYEIPVMEDLGSGSFIDLSRFGLRREPTVGEVLRAGVDVVTFSGDKLLGGPQAGLILGQREIIARIKKNPLNRALRIDKFTLAGLETVLRCYFDEEKALTTLPTLAMLTLDPEIIRKRAKRLARRIGKQLAGSCRVSVRPTGSRVGGGAMPEQDLPSWAVALAPEDRTINDLETGLRGLEQPVIGRIEDEQLLLDMRTVADDQVLPLGRSLLALFRSTPP